MSTHIQYELATGRIEVSLMCPAAELAGYAKPGFAMLQDQPLIDDRAYYIANGVLTLRPANPTTIAGTILSNVPVPAVVSINGTPFDTADATVDLGLTLMGTYAVVVKAFPYLDKTFTVVVA